MDPNACLKEIGEQLTQIGGEYDRVTELIEALADWLNKDGFEPDENLNAYNWEDVIPGAYWFYCHHHDGQWSDEYRLVCQLGRLFKPGPCSYGPEPDSGEKMVYDDLVRLWREKNGIIEDDDDTDDCE